jgi:acyl-CoA synthetase (AMP-forming)/AMP-acid ligase II
MIKTDVIKPLGQLLEERAVQYGSKVAYWDSYKNASYSELNRQSKNIAKKLRIKGLNGSDKVAIYLPNSVNWVLACFGSVRAGLVVVPISHDAAPGEVSYRITDSGAHTIVTTKDRLGVLEGLKSEVNPKLQIIIVDEEQIAGCENFSAYCTDLKDSVDEEISTSIDDIAFIVYTSGTTGKAKGVQLTLRSMLWVVAACWIPIAEMNDKDVVLSPLPLFHSYALNFSVLSIVAAGASEFIVEKYSSSHVLSLLKTGKFTVLPGVPTMFHYILESAKADSAVKLNGMRLCISAGAIMPADLNKGFEEFFGIKLLDGYGITETSTMVTMNSPIWGRTLGSCGLPVVGVAVRIVDPTTSVDLGPGQEGELIVRGPNVMVGYHNKPTETAAALKNGWYHTGDLAKADANGYLTITGRLKELIIRGGQNIAPGEIEESVLRHPAILDCAAVGIEHKHLGEIPVVFVVLREGKSVEDDALIEFTKGHLSAYKVPVEVHVVKEIPRTGSGKIMRFKLKETI